MFTKGDQLKNYEIIAPLTEGGMATLVLARRKRPNEADEIVALKVIHEHLSDDSGLIRLFFDEARVTARVRHQNVVQVREVGLHEGAYFLVMEYVHGVSLANLLGRLSMERRRLAPALAIHLAVQTADALHAAHEASDARGRPLHIVHRDVSPQNVLLSHLGDVKLIDFGIATSQTGIGVLGKLSYMAPEQIALAEIDRRTDVYSLGIVLWETLTGRTLFRSQNYDDYRDPAIRIGIAPPSRHCRDIPAALDEVVLRALAVAPEDRWPSAAAFRQALIDALPDARLLGTRELAAVVRSFAADDLSRLREHLPDDVTRAIEAAPGAPDAHTPDLALQLTLEQLDVGPSMLPRSMAPPRPGWLFGARAQLRLDSLDPAPSLPRLPATLPWSHAQLAGGAAALATTCLVLGIVLGRATAHPAPVAVSAAIPVASAPLPSAPEPVRAAEPRPPVHVHKPPPHAHVTNAHSGAHPHLSDGRAERPNATRSAHELPPAPNPTSSSPHSAQPTAQASPNAAVTATPRANTPHKISAHDKANNAHKSVTSAKASKSATP